MKKLLALLLALAMVFSLAACGGSAAPAAETKIDAPAGEAPAAGGELAGTYDITVWCADAIVDLTKQQIEDFNANNTDGITFNATVEAVGEGDAATQMITDVEAGGDLFCFAQDQFARLVQAGALSKLGVQAAEMVRTANDEGAVSASTLDGDIYAYPLTSDNGYFMYYDKSTWTLWRSWLRTAKPPASTSPWRPTLPPGTSLPSSSAPAACPSGPLTWKATGA